MQDDQDQYRDSGAVPGWARHSTQEHILQINFDGQTARVTGAGSGIGAAIARALAASGGRVIVAGASSWRTAIWSRPRSRRKSPPLLAALPPGTKEALVAVHPIGRLGTAEEVTHLVLVLLSDKATFISGSCHLVDGGYTAQ